MPYPLDDTIAAIASPAGGAARGIIRLSGLQVRKCLEACFRAEPSVDLTAIASPTAVGGSLRLAGSTSPLPCQLYLWPGRRSYTGQPVAEIHTLGSPPLLQLALRTVCRAGARPAEPGEFTLRAFLAGRIDLTQAEAVLGVIDAANPQELQTALGQLAGGLARPLHQLRNQLLELLVHLEAGFDFPDEDFPFITPQQLSRTLREAAQTVARIVRQMTSRGEAAEAARVVLVGCPNTGKSSLFNALAGAAGALVSDEPGTTRDYLTAELDLDGVKCQLIDTAGVQSPSAGPAAELHQAAQAMASREVRRSQLRLLCIDCTRPLNDWERRELAREPGAGRVVVLTKIDAMGGVGIPACPTADSNVGPTRQVRFAGPLEFAVATSGVTGQGIDALRREVRRALLGIPSGGAGAVASTAARCHQALRLALGCLKRARETARARTGEELIAAEVRTALDELGKVVGAVYTEDVLDRVFSRFCVGK